MNRMQKNINEVVSVLTERPIHAADVERILIAYDIMEDYIGSSQPARFAGYLSSILDRVSVPLEDYDLIAGRSVIRELTDEEENIILAWYNALETDETARFHRPEGWDEEE